MSLEQIAAQTTEWLAATGAPNAVVLMFLVTSLPMWAKRTSNVVDVIFQKARLTQESEEKDGGG